MTPVTERFETRLSDDLLARVDQWRGRQEGLPNRSEAVRRLLERALAAAEKSPFDVSFSAGERVIIGILQEHYERTSQPSALADLAIEALATGNYWALPFERHALFQGDDPTAYADAQEVMRILDMYTMLERSYANLPVSEQKELASEFDLASEGIWFRGFDANEEGVQFSIARLLIEMLGRWSHFKEREMNSHFPELPRYRKMLRKFQGIPQAVRLHNLHRNEIARVLDAGV